MKAELFTKEFPLTSTEPSSLIINSIGLLTAELLTTLLEVKTII